MPLFGVSAGDYKKTVVELYKQKDFQYAAQHQYAAHNFYIYTLASSGLIGLLFLLMVLIIPFLLRRNDTSLFLLIFSLFCFTEDMLLRQQGVIAFSYFYVILQARAK